MNVNPANDSSANFVMRMPIPAEQANLPLEITTFDQFRHFLSETLGVAEETLRPEAHFLYDLGIESLTMVELLLQLELRLGRKIPVDTAWNIETIADAYQFYVDQVNHA